MTTDVLGLIAPHPPIMVPEVGHADADVTAASAQALVRAALLLASYAPETVILMSPHAPLVYGAFAVDDSASTSGSLASFGAASVRISAHGDPELAAAVLDAAAEEGLPAVPRSQSPRLEPGVLDHGALVPLSFLDRAGHAALVELSLSTLPLHAHHEFGRAVRRAVEKTGRRVAFLASGDCSHRLTHSAPAGFSPHAAAFDARLVELIAAGDFRSLEEIDAALIEEAGECGLRSFIALGGFLEGTDAKTRVLAYEGPWGVGYLTAVAASPALLASLDALTQTAPAYAASTPATSAAAQSATAPAAESPPVALARHAIETFLSTGKVLSPPTPTGLLAERHGAFVSLHRHGDLRGCIGTIGPTRASLAEEIVRNAIEAATADPRFPAMTPDELRDLEISVDVLHTPEPATFADLDPKTYGVIVTSGYARGLLLPDLDGVDTAEMQVDIARRKAGIAPEARITLQRFRVDRYH